MRRVLTNTFFTRSAPEVAQDLLGKKLVREIDGKRIESIITETEAYEGTHDLACHAAKGRTKRTEVMFGEGGIFYVYLIYGMYSMLNVVTGRSGHPAAVLIRSVDLISGPGRLTRELSINREFNALPAQKSTGLWFEDGGNAVPAHAIIATPRVGVTYAGPIWSKKPWRFVVQKPKMRMKTNS